MNMNFNVGMCKKISISVLILVILAFVLLVPSFRHIWLYSV